MYSVDRYILRFAPLILVWDALAGRLFAHPSSRTGTFKVS